MEAKIFQNFNRIPELAFLRVIRDLTSVEQPFRKIYAVFLALQTFEGGSVVNKRMYLPVFRCLKQCCSTFVSLS